MKQGRKLRDRMPESKLNEQDKAILRILHPVAEGIAKAFGHDCEVVIHSLEDLGHSITKIVNSHVTGRNVGSPMTDYGLMILNEAELSGNDVFGHYYTKLDDGRQLKSVTVLVRNAKGNPVGIICINIDILILNISTFSKFYKYIY